jgi:hypothetical protein
LRATAKLAGLIALKVNPLKGNVIGCWRRHDQKKGAAGADRGAV